MIEEIGSDSATLAWKAGMDVWIPEPSGVGAAEAEVSSEPVVIEAGVGGGTGAFLFRCWLSEPRPIW